jgi:hypothetical protein
MDINRADVVAEVTAIRTESGWRIVAAHVSVLSPGERRAFPRAPLDVTDDSHSWT